ncbi:MAG: hypothetical protein HFE74_07685 [Firmicutes bacterium]|jgi:hypothetical protein|nr:hypothetical protein [Bacillota bacterium]
MIKNLVEYFDAQQEFYLDKVSYSRIETKAQAQQHLLNCVDRIDADVNEDVVKLSVNRTIKFEPKEIFELTVKYGVILKLKKEKINEYRWNEINLADEFAKNGDFVLQNIMSRMTLLISEITASFGQPPIILPPLITLKDNQD